LPLGEKAKIREAVMYKPRDIQGPKETNITAWITRQEETAKRDKATGASLGEICTEREASFWIAILKA
jgi:hypothetical protein